MRLGIPWKSATGVKDLDEMSDNLQFVRDLFKRADVSLSQNDVWAIQGTPVVKHKALERLAAAMKIRFSAPTILRAERDEAVILVVGQIVVAETNRYLVPPGGVVQTDPPTTLSEWSIGEALVNVNYRVTGKMAAYVYAMAEKRGKDRVILKLAGLQGVYSEDEADDFKEPPGPSMSERAEAAEKKITAAKTDEELKTIWRGLDDDLKPIFRLRVANLGAELKRSAA
jgi:hypothetical protein